MAETEATFANSEKTTWWWRLWTIFNNLRNPDAKSGWLLSQCSPPTPVNIGIDSDATVIKGTAIIDHEKEKAKAKFYNEDGSMNLGRKVSKLHRDTPWKKAWSLIKDGDLWVGTVPKFR